MKKEKRIEVICWNCNQQFSSIIEIKDDENHQQENSVGDCSSEVLSMDCPICGSECMLDLTPYLRKNSEIIYR